MSIFDSFKNNDVKIETVKDTVGGGLSFGVVETGIYPAKIKQAYLDESSGGAHNVNFEFETDSGNLIRSKVYFTSGKAKGLKNYYVDKKTGKNRPLPGYTLLSDIMALVAEIDVKDTDTDTKQVMIYNFEQSKQMPESREVITALLNQRIILAVEKIVEDKKVNDGNGNYIASGETREINEVVKVFCAEDEVTFTEKKAGLTEATFMTAWETKNAGKTVNNSTAQPAAPSAPAQPVASTPTPSATKSIFG